MNNKGFTLIEVLAVVIILSLLTLLVFPNITNSVRNFGSKTDDLTLNMIEKAASLYVDDNQKSFMKSSENIYCVPLTKLVEENYLKEGIEYNNKDITNTKVLKVTYDSGFNYELVDKKDCERVIKFDTVCEYVNNGVAEKTVGSKYECKVDPNRNAYTFYVLNTRNKAGEIITETTTDKTPVSINLIMDRNICDDGLPTEEGKTCLVAYNSSGDAAGVGPTTAMMYLNNATNSWSNIPNLNLTYDDEGGNFTGYVLNGKARLPYKKEVNDFNNNNGYLYENLDGAYWYYDESTKPTNSISNIYGYWTLSSYAFESYNAFFVHCRGSVVITSVDDKGYINSMGYGPHYGVRPVINLSL